MPPLHAQYIASGVHDGWICHAFLVADLSQVGSTADLLRAVDPEISATAEAEARFQTPVKASKRMPPSGILMLVRDGRPKDFEAAPLALVNRAVRCSAVKGLQLAFGEEQRLAATLVDFPIGEQRRAAMRTLLELRQPSAHGDGPDGRLDQACIGALKSLVRLGLAFECQLLSPEVLRSDRPATHLDEPTGDGVAWDVSLVNLPAPTKRGRFDASLDQRGAPATPLPTRHPAGAPPPTLPSALTDSSATPARRALDLLMKTPTESSRFGISFLDASLQP